MVYEYFAWEYTFNGAQLDCDVPVVESHNTE